MFQYSIREENMNRKKIKKMGSRIIAFQVAAVLLVTTAFVGIPAKKAKAAEEKIQMDESAYNAIGFDTSAEDAEESYLGPGNTVLYPQNELYFDFNGSSNYGYVMRDNLDLYQTIGDNLSKAGAYERYGQYKNGDWAKLEGKYGYTQGSLGGQELNKSLYSNNKHKSRAYATSTAFKSASGKDDRVAQLYVTAGRNRSEYQVCLEILKFKSSYQPVCASTVTLGSPAALDQKGGWYNEQFDALFEVTAGDYNGDGVDEVAVYYADNTVKVYKTANDRLALWKTIGISELQAQTGKTIEADSEKNNGKPMAAVVSLASGDLQKDYTEDLIIGVSMPEVSGVNKNNRVFLYGYHTESRQLVKDKTIDLNEIADGSDKIPMLAVNVAAGDLTGNGRQELVIGGRVGQKIGVIHVEYDFGMQQYEATSAQLMEEVDGNLRDRTVLGPGYRAPIGLSICNFGKVGESCERLFLFDRLYSYADSLFTAEDQKLYYALNQRNNANEKADKDAVWISKVLSGNFTGNPDSSEQLAALVGVKEKNQDKYWYQICFISYKNNQWYTSWEGIINQATSYLNRSDVARASAYVALSMPDVDDDSMLLKYLGTETFYTKPEVQAVLQSAPYFQDVADTYDNYLNEGSTAYGVSKGSGNSVTAGFELSLGIYTAGGISLFGEGEIEMGVSASTNYEHQTSWETSTSVEYAVGQGDDYVVMFTIPYHRYWYEYEEKDGSRQKMTIEEPLTPSTVVVPVDVYDAMAETYQGLEPIGGNLLNSVPGEPSTYTRTFQGEGCTRIGDVQRLANAGANSSSNVTVSREANVTKEDSVSFAVEEDLKVGGGVGLFGTGSTTGITQSFSVSAGYVHSKMNGVSYAGTVDNLPAGVSGYGFNWQFGAREARLNDETVVVIGYQTSNVQEPPKVPKNLTITEIGSREMVLEWDVSAGAAVYELMLITNNGMELPQASIPSTQADENGIMRYQVSNLTPNMQYSYTVTAIDGAGVQSLPGARVSGTTLPENHAGFKITVQPEDKEVAVGGTARFSIQTENDGSGSLNYRWQTYDASAKEWRYISGEYDRMMSVTGEKDLDGSKYRCIVYTGGTMLISSPATLTIGKSESRTDITIRKATGENQGNYAVVQASGTREEQVKVGEQQIPYTVTVEKDGVTYTKMQNSQGDVLWVSSDENGDHYYEDTDGDPANTECPVSEQIIFTSQSEEVQKTYTADADLITELPDGVTLPEGIGQADAYRISGTENEYLFVVSGEEEGIRYYDKEGTELSLYDTQRLVTIKDTEVVNTSEFQEVEAVRTEDVYESRTVVEKGDEIHFMAEVSDVNDGKAVADQIPYFQIVNTATGVSATAAASKDDTGAYIAKYTFQQAGIYEITAVYGGSEQYTMSRSDSMTLVVKGAETEKQLFISGGSMTYGETMNLSPRMLDADGVLEQNVHVTYTVMKDNVPMDAGKAGISGNRFTPNAVGTYQITAQDTENQVEISSVIKVSRRTLTITPADVEGGLADSREVRTQKLNSTLSHVNTEEQGKVFVQGLAGSDEITDYTLSSEALRADKTGEYPILVTLDERSENIKELSKNYAFVLNRGVYRLSQDRVQVNAEAGSNGSIRIRYQMNGGQTIEVSSGTYIPKGAKVTVTALPFTGFGIEKWMVNGAEQSHTGETYTVDALEQDITIKALFSYHYSTLEYSAAANGSIQGFYEGGGQIAFASGGRLNQNQSVVLTAVPDEGFVVDHWGIQRDLQSAEETIKAEDQTSTYTGDTYTVSNVKEDTIVNVYFKAKEEKTITLQFKNLADGTDVSTEGMTLEINGVRIEEENRRYTYQSFAGDNLTLDITIPDNMLVDYWAEVKDDGSETTAAGNVKQIKLYNLAQNVNYVVYCSIPNASEITYGCVLDDTHGNGGELKAAGEITAEGVTSSPVSRPQGTEIVFTAVPKDGYSIRRWTVDGKEVTANITEKEDGSQTYRMEVKADTEVRVHFEKNPVVTVTADASQGEVTAMADGTAVPSGSAVAFGSSVEWTITPKKGYEIAQATLNGEDVTEELSVSSNQKDIRSFAAEDVHADQRLTVTYRTLETYTVRYAVQDLDGDGTGDYGSIEALAGRLGIGAYREEKEAALAGEITVYEGGEAIFTPAPEQEAYSVKECTVNGSIRALDAEGTIRLTGEEIKALGGTAELTVKFGEARYNKLEYTAGAHGSLKGSYEGDGQIAFASGGRLNQDQTVILTAIPEEGFVVDHWGIQRVSQSAEETIKAEDQTSTYTGDTYTVSNVKEDTIVNVYFKAKEEKTITLQFKNLADGTDVSTEGMTLEINGVRIEEENRRYTYQSFAGDNLTLDITIPDNMLVDYWAEVKDDGSETTAAGNVKQIKLYNLAQNVNYVVYCSIPNASEITYGCVLDDTHGNGGELKAAGEITAEGVTSSPVSRPQGTEIVFTAVPKDGYSIRRWTVDGKEVTANITEKEDGSQTYRMEVKADTEVRVHFEKNPVVTVTADASQGEVTAMADGTAVPSGSAVAFGSSVEWTITPKKGYEIAQATLNGEDVTEELSVSSNQKDIRSFAAEDVHADQRLTVTYRTLETYTVRYAVQDLDGDGTGDYGSIEALAGRLGIGAYREEKGAALAGEITVYEGGEVIFTPVPEQAEYRVTECLVNGDHYELQQDGTILLPAEQLAALGQTINLTVKFGASAPVITFTDPTFNGEEKGTISAFAAGTEIFSGAAVNGAVTFRVLPDENYEVKQWTVNGKEVPDAAGNEFVYENTARVDTRITAILQGVPIHVTAVAENENAGTVEALPEVIRYGDDVTLRAEITPGFVFDGWYLGEEKVSSETAYTFVAEKDVSYVAKFEVKQQKEAYAIVLENTENGAIRATADGLDVTAAEEGTEVTFEAVPEPYWSFGGWLINGQETTYGASFTMVAGKDFQEDITVKAVFTKAVYYDVSFGVDGNGGVVEGRANGESMTSDVVMQKVGGSALSFQAVPDDGNMTAEWRVNGELVKDNVSNELVIPNLFQNTEVKVSFKPYKGYEVPVTTDVYTVKDVERTPADTAAGEEIREDGTLTFTISPSEEDAVFKKLEIYGVDCLNVPSGEEQEIQIGDKKSVITVIENADHSYTVVIKNVQAEIKAGIAAETAVLLEKAEVTVSGNETFLYNGEEQIPTQVVVTVKGTVLTADDYDITYHDNRNAGTAKITVVGKGAYTGTALGTYQILPRPLTVSADNVSKSYGYEDPELTYQVSGLVSGDVIKADLKRQDGENPGRYTIQVGAEAGSNYQVTCQNGTFTIRDGGLPLEMVNRLNAGLRMTWKGSQITIQWGGVSIADGYDVFVADCNKKYPKKPTATVKGAEKTRVKIRKVSGKKLKSAKDYKAIIKPYRMEGGKKKYTAVSYSLHYAGKNNKNLTNIKKIRVKKSYILKKGKKAKIKTKLLMEKKGKSPIMHVSAAGKGVRFWSSDKKIATVTGKGKIKAVSRGRCTIYVMAENGVKAKVRVTVK